MMNNNMLKQWIIYILMISLTVAAPNAKWQDKCEELKQLKEYQAISIEIVKDLRALRNENIALEIKGDYSIDLQANINTIIFDSLNDTCIKFTEILAFKDQLLKQISDNNTTLKDENILKLFSLIIKLQTAAMNLQGIKRHLHCITFSSEQYELIYFSRLHVNNDLVISLATIAGTKWQNKTNACED